MPAELRLSAIVDAVRQIFTLAGFLYFVDLYRKRSRIRVSILNEDFYSGGPAAISLEVQNVGLTPSSIEPVIVLKAFLPRPGRTPDAPVRLKRYEITLNVEGSDRALPPYTPVRLRAANERLDHGLSGKLGFTWFKTYTFRFTRGRTQRLRIRSADGVPLSWWRYVYERLDFRVRGHVTLPSELEGAVTDALSK